jgi:hypothetical protein
MAQKLQNPIPQNTMRMDLIFIFIIPFEISSATALSDPALYILLTLQVPNLMTIFFRLGRLSKESVQVRGFFRIFVTSLFFTMRSF